MAARLALVLSAAFLCLMLGLVSAPATPAVVTPAHPLRLASLRLDPPAEADAAAAAALSGSAPRPPGPPQPVTRPRLLPTAAPPPPPPPPPPGPDQVLRSSVAAVTEDGGRLSLVLAGGGRRLRAGEAFMGWTVASVSRTGAVLSRGGARREVSFFAPAPSAGSGSEPGFGPGFGSGTGYAAAPLPTTAGVLPPVAIPPPHAPATRPSPPTAAEFFRGFKG